MCRTKHIPKQCPDFANGRRKHVLATYKQQAHCFFFPIFFETSKTKKQNIFPLLSLMSVEGIDLDIIRRQRTQKILFLFA